MRQHIDLFWQSPFGEKKGGLPPRTIDLVHLRASQINGCSVCVDMHARELKQAGESDERIFTAARSRVRAWEAAHPAAP